jgi:hypothetical protein
MSVLLFCWNSAGLNYLQRLEKDLVPADISKRDVVTNYLVRWLNAPANSLGSRFSTLAATYFLDTEIT